MKLTITEKSLLIATMQLVLELCHLERKVKMVERKAARTTVKAVDRAKRSVNSVRTAAICLRKGNAPTGTQSANTTC